MRRNIDEMLECFIPSNNSVSGKHPYVAMVVSSKSMDDVRRHSVLPSIHAKHAIVIADQATIDAVEPQVSGLPLQHGAELIRKQPRGLSIEESQMDAVKAG